MRDRTRWQAGRRLRGAGAATAAVLLALLTATAAPSAWASAATTISWTTGASSPIQRHEAFGGFASDGRLYTFGGYYGQPDYTPSRRVDAYDPRTNTWTRRRDLPTGLTHAATAIDGTSVYVAGGYPQQADGTGQDYATTAVWRYDTAADTYTALPAMPLARGGGALVLAGRTLHVFGGSDGARRDTATHYTLSLDGGTTWNAAAPMPVPRNHLAGVLLRGTIYALGGQSGQDAAATYRAQMDAYDVATDTWTTKAPLPQAESHENASTFVLDDRIIVAGGEVSYGNPTDAVSSYDPIAGHWSRLTPLPAARSAAVASTWAGRIYVANGNGTHTLYVGTVQQPTGGAASAPRALAAAGTHEDQTGGRPSGWPRQAR